MAGGKSKISGTEWFLVILALLFLDAIQFGLELLSIPTAGFTTIVSEVIEFFVGPTLIFYFWMRGIKLTWQRTLSLVGAWVGEEIPGLDMAPFWTADAGFIYLSVKAEEGGLVGEVAGGAQKALGSKVAGSEMQERTEPNRALDFPRRPESGAESMAGQRSSQRLELQNTRFTRGTIDQKGVNGISVGQEIGPSSERNELSFGE